MNLDILRVDGHQSYSTSYAISYSIQHKLYCDLQAEYFDLQAKYFDLQAEYFDLQADKSNSIKSCQSVYTQLHN